MSEKIQPVQFVVRQTEYSKTWVVSVQVGHFEDGDPRYEDIYTDYRNGYTGLQPEGHDTADEALRAFARLLSRVAQKEAM